MSELAPRAVCYRCDKPAVLCVCARIPRVENATRVIVLQHPRERLHPIGTARFARLGLCNVHVEVAWNAGQREEAPPPWLPANSAVLYPSPTAVELASLAPHERPQNLVVLDGTWHTARTLWRDKAWLQRLPCVRLTPSAPSRYRLRLEPFADYVSTIEAIVGALVVLEPQTEGLHALLAAFESMIDDQLAYVLKSGPSRHSRKRRAEAERRLPAALVDGLSRIVVVYTETAREGSATNAPRKLVQVTGVALGTGELRQWACIPHSELPAPNLLEHMRLAADDFDAAVDLATFRREWREFLASGGPQPIVAAWNQSSFDALASADAALPERLVLKSAYRARHGKRHAGLEDVIAGEGLVPEPLPARGRAARRLACALAIARHLNALAHSAATSP